MDKLKDSKTIHISNVPEEPLIHKLDEKKAVPASQLKIAAVIIILLGLVSGFAISTLGKKSASGSSVVSGIAGTKAVGSSDNKTFPDSAEGELEAGGLNGEGTHKLIRPGGDSQTVYLTSSVMDLNQFVGKKVKVWGQTFAAKSAGWLMDVGKVEISQ